MFSVPVDVRSVIIAKHQEHPHLSDVLWPFPVGEGRQLAWNGAADSMASDLSRELHLCGIEDRLRAIACQLVLAKDFEDFAENR